MWVFKLTVTGRGYPYRYPHPPTTYMDIHTDIRADVFVELSVLKTVRPGQANSGKMFSQLKRSLLSLVNCYIPSNLQGNGITLSKRNFLICKGSSLLDKGVFLCPHRISFVLIQVMFCDESCRDMGLRDFHSAECSILQHLVQGSDLTPVALLVYRAVMKGSKIW